MNHKNKKTLLGQVDLKKALILTTSEIHLGNFPVFCISSNKPTETMATYEETRTLSDGSQVGRRWQVTVDPHFGWPGEYDAQVWRALEHILHLRKIENCLTNPFHTTFGEIYSHMRRKSKGGSDWNRIEKSLARMTRVTIHTDCWYRADIHERRSSEFHLINRNSIHKKKQADGRNRRNGVTIELSEEYFISITKRYVRPLDKGFRDNLTRWMSRRLYEILSSKFYGLRDKSIGYHIKYSRICALLGSTPQPHLSYAKRIFGRVHEELQFHKFLGKVVWWEAKNTKKDWVLVYWPGEVAKAQLQENYWNVPEHVKSPLFIEKVPEGAKIVWVDEPDESNIDGKLTTKKAPDQAVVEEKLSPTPNGSNFEGNYNISNKNKELLNISIILAIYENVIGRRKMPTLSENEKVLVEKWNKAGVIPDDVEKGLCRVIHQESVKAKHTGRTPCPIWSLSYCEWGVWAAFDSRQKAEQRQKELEKEQAEIEEHKKKKLEKSAALEEKRKSYTHIPQWPEIQEEYHQRINAENNEKVMRIILASRWDNETLNLLMSDSFAADWFKDNYLKNIIDYSGAKEVELEIEEPI